MEIYNEDEQVAQIKAWIREYLPTVLTSIIIVVAIFFGWRFWQNHQVKTKAEASIQYEQMLTSNASNDNDVTKQLAENLKTNYKRTPYAALAALLLAKVDAEAGKYQQAQSQLQWVMNNGKTQTIKQVARNRAARLYIANNKPKQALALLEKVEDSSYKPAIESIRGDAYVALGEKAKAHQAYSAALQALPKKTASWPILKMKLNEVAMKS